MAEKADMADGLGLTDLLDGYGGHGGNRVLSVEDVSEAGVFDRGDPGDLDQGRCKGRHARTVAGGPGQQEKDRRRTTLAGARLDRLPVRTQSPLPSRRP